MDTIICIENHHWCLLFEKILKCNYNILTKKCLFIFLFQYLFIAILCAEMSRVNKALANKSTSFCNFPWTGVGHQRPNQPGVQQEVGRGPGERRSGQRNRANHFQVKRELNRFAFKGNPMRVRRKLRRRGDRTRTRRTDTARAGTKQYFGNDSRITSTGSGSKPDQDDLLFSADLHAVDRPLIRSNDDKVGIFF